MEEAMVALKTPYDELTFRINGLAMMVHTELGPGLPEKIYQAALLIAMEEDNMQYDEEYPVQVSFHGRPVGGFRLDLVVERKAIVEVKATATLANIHAQQIITYLAASRLPVGLLLNFGAAKLEHKRFFPPRAVQAAQARSR